MQRLLKQAIVAQVRAFFHDPRSGERPVQRSAEALFAPDSIAWRVHGDVTSMMVGGIASLLLQMLHPKVLAGVWDHSGFRDDMHGRLRRTARFIAVTTYARRSEAEAAIARVRAIHERVSGALPDGTPYRAADPALLLWVHATESLCFLDAWRRYSEPAMSASDQDRYFTEVAQVAEALGAAGAPTSRAETLALIATMRPELRADARTREVRRILLAPSPAHLAAVPVQALLNQAAIDLLPSWARRMHHLPSPSFARAGVRGGALAMARTLRWAFRQSEAAGDE